MQPEISSRTHEIKRLEQTTCCIVGGGPLVQFWRCYWRAKVSR